MEKKTLGQSSYFSSLTAEELQQVQNRMQIKTYQEEEIIFFEGEAGEGLFFLQTGKVKLTKMIESGKEQILKILQPGSVFAEVVLFDGGVYPATAIAMEDTQVGVIRKQTMEQITKEFPDITYKLLQVMSKRLRRAQERVRNLGLKNTKGRTASILVYLAQEYGGTKQAEVEIDLSLTQAELANLIGTSRETVSRILNKFKKQGLVTVARQKIIIEDLPGLKEIAE